MEVKLRKDLYSTLDTILYCLLCILSLGTIYIFRLIITQAIKMAFKDEA